MSAVIDSLNAPSTVRSASANAALGQEDFLKLMVTQLTTQDPFNPVENTEMIAQMAQFSSVAGISELNQSMKTIAQAMNPSRISDAASWIGRSMLVTSPVATPLANGVYAGELNLPKGADQISISFVDESGAVVHTADLGAQPSGPLEFAWEGVDAAGQRIANGPLRIVVDATAGGEQVTPTVATWTTITSIKSPASGGATQLVTDLGLMQPEQALRLG